MIQAETSIAPYGDSPQQLAFIRPLQKYISAILHYFIRVLYSAFNSSFSPSVSSVRLTQSL